MLGWTAPVNPFLELGGGEGVCMQASQSYLAVMVLREGYLVSYDGIHGRDLIGTL